jgi:predicted membrane channel-forming protein YqfA (hemolysin III family)
MNELINILSISLFFFLAGVFFAVSVGELKRGETLIKTCFVAGVYCVILAFLQIICDLGIIDINLLIILVIIEFAVYMAITIYALRYVKSTTRYI